MDYSMMRLRRIIFITLACLMIPTSVLAEAIVIAVRAHNGLEHAYQRWQPTIDYLQNEISWQTFELKAVEDIDEMEAMVEQNQLDFVLTQPLAYVDLERLYGVTRLLTLVKQDGLTQYGSVIITRADRKDIQDLSDAEDKTIAAVTHKGFGGWLIGYQEMTRHGIDSVDDFESVDFLGGHNKVVLSVVSGQHDIGVVRTGILEKMQQQDSIDIDQIKVLNARQTDNFPFHLSTDLYPEWAFAKTRRVDSALSKLVTIKLLTIGKDSVEARLGEYSEWGMAQDYSSVHELMKQLKVGSYSDHGDVDSWSFIIQNKYIAMVLLLLLLSSVAGFFRVRHSNQLLLQEKEAKARALQDLEHMAKHDALTGLPNRYLINELIQNQFHLSRRNKTRNAILFIDLDNFKTINDHYGHKFGDVVLQQTGEILKSMIRRSDLCGRLGGDEFIVSMHHVTDIEGVTH